MPLDRLIRDLLDLMVAERERWGLWLPVLLGFGIAGYFALAGQPPAAVLWPLGGVILLAGLLGRRMALPLVGLAATALGFAAGEVATLRAAHPLLPGRLGPVAIEGRIIGLDARDDRHARIVLDRLDAADPAVRALGTVRLSIDQDEGAPAVAVGQRIAARAVLLPPPGPAMAGAPDYGLKLWFDGLGAVGYAVEPLAILDPAGRPPPLEAARQAIAGRIEAALPGSTGAIATALTVGLRGRIPEDVEARWRDAGIAHILSISGLHLSLAAGVVFVALRLGFAAWGTVALRYPVKKWAAAVAILSCLGYMLLAGAEVPAVRSFIMTALLFLAVLVDRLALTMRLVAVAAGLVLLVEPQSLLDVSFGMSFASVVGLIATYETLRVPLVRWRGGLGRGLFGRALLYLGGIALSSLVATLVTAPFALHHFGRFVVYGVLTNLAAIPLTAFVVMPAAVATALAMPFGLEAWPLAIMGFGIEAIDSLAAAVAAWPHAVLPLPAMPAPALAAAVLGGLWLALWRGLTLRLFGLIGVVLSGLLWLAMARPPDLLVHQDGRAVAVPAGDRLAVLAPGSPGFIVEQWQDRLGLAGTERLGDDGAAGPLACAGFRCTITAPAGAVLLLRGRPRWPLDDCPDVVLVPRQILATPPCRTPPELLVDRAQLAGRGTLSLWLGAAPRLRFSETERGLRPWTPAYWAAATDSGGTGRPGRPEP